MRDEGDAENTNNWGAYGPQTERVEWILKRVDENYSTYFDVIVSYYKFLGHDPGAWPIWSETGWAVEALVKVAKASGREDIYRDLEVGLPYGAPYGLIAVVMEDWVGPIFTKEHYEFLITPLLHFLTLLRDTEPNTPQRDLAIDFLRTMNCTEAIALAKLTLID